MYLNPQNKDKLEISENGLCSGEEIVFPKINGVFKIAPSQGYTSNFGFQWNNFKKTQIDKFNGLSQSRNRFFKVTNWDKQDLKEKKILEVGSGAGRFSQVILDHTQAELFSVDYSDAVDANYLNNGPHPRLKLFKASVYELPFEENSFDKVFCFGVLQHTRDVHKTIECLYRMAKPGGEVIIDFYCYNGFWTLLHSKYMFRPFIKYLSHEKLLKIIQSNITWMINVTTFFSRIGIGKYINRFIPICDIEATFPDKMDKALMKEWAILDTFDMFSPAYDKPQKIKNVSDIFHTLKMKEVWGGQILVGKKNKVAFVRGTK